MNDMEVIVYTTLLWYVSVNIAQETDKGCIQIKRSEKVREVSEM